LREAFGPLLDEERALAERVEGFREAVYAVQERSKIGGGFAENWQVGRPSLGFVAALLAAVDPQRFTFYHRGKLRFSYEEFVGQWPAGSRGTLYATLCEFVRAVFTDLRQQGAPARDLIDAQSFLWLRAQDAARAPRDGTSQTDRGGARFWWVNQGLSYPRSRAGGYMWAPLEDKAGGTPEHWRAMRDVREGDVVFNYANSQLRGCSVAAEAAVPAPRPDPDADQAWGNDGLRVELTYRDLVPPIQLSEIPVEWRIGEGGPFTRDGSVKQGYLFPVSESFVAKLAQRFPQLELDLATPAETPTRAWLVRGANVDGRNLVPEWIEQGFVSIGWPVLGELPGPVSKDDLAAAVAEAYPEESPGARRASVGNLHRFLNLMRPGHFAVATDGDDVYVGRVLGDPHYDASGFMHAVRRRPVEWLNATDPASRARVQSDFPTLYSRMRTLLTVTDLKEDVTAVAALVGLAAKKEVASLSTLVPADDDLVRQVYLPREWLQEVIELLTEKRQLIFYGPPGTGKTFLAQRLAEHLTRQGGALEIVQFHPSYGYEDFFEGYRPAQTTDGVGVTYELTPGPLRRIAEAATQDLQHPYVLVIDEINRGNLPKIFGELLFLLEYREAQIPLQYSPETPFGLPKNLFVIGTMNTADRSIALVDAALRRRFYFVPFMPTEAPVRDVLPSWLKDKGLEDRPARLLAALNERIANEEIAIGPSYFMSSDSKAPDLARIWKHAILPVLEEHFYGVDRDVETEFGLEALEKALNPQVEAANLEFDQADESV
jgi:5-methylcytosine-specific restriction protein B